MELSEELQVTWFETSCELPSLHVPVAVNCWVAFVTTDEFTGVTIMAERIGVIVSDLEPLTEPTLAVIVVVPAATPVAMPAPLTLATLGELDAQAA
jgi:hypothetical protein